MTARFGPTQCVCPGFSRQLYELTTGTGTQNAVEDLHNLMLAANSDAFSSVSTTSYIGRLALLGSLTNWNTVLGGSNDDAQVM